LNPYLLPSNTIPLPWVNSDYRIPEFESELEIYKKWDSRPRWFFSYRSLGEAYHKTGQYKKEKKLYKQAQRDFPDAGGLFQRKAILALSEGRNKTANKHIEKYKSIRRNNSDTEAAITLNLAKIYTEAGMLDKAEEYYRKALSLQSSASRLTNLAWFLINNDRNINKGLELVDEALALSPDNHNFLDCKGWGLYKQGNYEEALEILQNSWDLRMKNAIYRHIPFLHLEEVKKAVDSQKNNN